MGLSMNTELKFVTVESSPTAAGFADGFADGLVDRVDADFIRPKLLLDGLRGGFRNRLNLTNRSS